MKNAKRIFNIICIILLSLGLTGWGGYYYVTSGNYPEIIKPLPDVLSFNNGSKVQTAEEWQVRREEIKSLLLNIEYGTMPGRPDAIIVTKNNISEEFNNHTRTKLRFSIIPSNSTPIVTINFTVWIYEPTGPGPFPVMLRMGKDSSDTDEIATDLILNQGFLYLCFNYTELDPDTEGYDIVGPCQAIYPNYTWGSLAVWTWGAIRIVDYIFREQWVSAPDGYLSADINKILTTGHSRRGKIALLTAAYDERIAMTIPSGSGCGGAGSYLVRNPFCETLNIITSEKLYKAWFVSNFSDYGSRLKDLPFDQHFLRALIAPRAIMSKDGFLDIWANPSGTQAMSDAAQPVFNLLGASQNNSLYFRAGGHSYTREDFKIVLSYVQYIFYNRTENIDPATYYMHPFQFRLP